MKVLITGINGFVGQYLLKELEARGYEVFGLDRVFGSSRVFNVDIIDQIKVNDALKETAPDFVIHLAAISSVDHKDATEIYNINFIGTLNLLTACVGLKVSPGFLYISSSQVYGNIPVNRLPIDESSPLDPVNHYGAGKAAAEMAVKAFGAEYGLQYVIARPFNHTGPGQTERFVVPRIVDAFRREAETIELGNIDTVRDFTDVRDIVKAYVFIIENFKNGSVYNISSGVGITVSEIFEMIINISGHKMSIIKGESLVRGNEILSVIGSSGKLFKETGWTPRVSMEQTLKDMLC